MMYRSGEVSISTVLPWMLYPRRPRPTTAGIPSTLNPLLRYYREFQSHSRGNTANTATLSLFSSNMPGLMWCPVQALQDHDTVSTAKPMLGRSLFLLQNRFLALVLSNLNRSG